MKDRLLAPEEARTVAGYLRAVSDHVRRRGGKDDVDDAEESELIEEAMKLPRLREAILAAQQRSSMYVEGERR